MIMALNEQAAFGGERNAKWDPARQRFTELVERSEAALMRTALRLCRGGHDCAAELVQDAIVRAYVAFRKGLFREGTNAQAWLVRILTNAFINEYRRKVRWDAGVDVDTLTAGGDIGPAGTQADPEDRPDTALLNSTFDEPLDKALKSLPDALRQTVLLVDAEGLSYDDAAQRMGVPVGTVRSRLARARYRLQELLRDYARDRRLA